jgi:hypothetical protein
MRQREGVPNGDPEGSLSFDVDVTPPIDVTVATPADRFAEGSVLGGRFVVERTLGRGGMGIVLATHDMALDRRVALKLLLPEALLHPDAVQRFIREGRSLAKLRNTHVARVLDVGHLNDGSPFMVMELLEGEDLGVRLDRDGAFSPRDAADSVRQACEALAEAHREQIVHRDIKPANLFLAREAMGGLSVKIVDFGISKSTSRADHSLTTTKVMVGSPVYMSPEQVKSPKTVDTRSDIWSLGVVLFELLTGKTPFDGDTLGEVFGSILEDPIPSAQKLDSRIPSGLDSVIRRCLARNRTQRFQTVQELSAALAPYGTPVPFTDSSRSLPPFSVTQSGPIYHEQFDPRVTTAAGELQTVRRHRMKWFAGGVTVAASVLAAFVFYKAAPAETSTAHGGVTVAAPPVRAVAPVQAALSPGAAAAPQTVLAPVVPVAPVAVSPAAVSNANAKVVPSPAGARVVPAAARGPKAAPAGSAPAPPAEDDPNVLDERY